MRRRRPPQRISPAYLSRVTARYLERYSTTSFHLKRLLMQRVRRAAAHHGDSVSEGETLVDDEIGRLLAAGLLDDARFARDRVRALHRRGNSSRAIRAKLAAKGVRGPVVDDALAALGHDVEWAAACTWARKRRVGPWRRGEADRQRELAKMGRAGFGYDVAARIVDAATPDELAITPDAR